MKKFRVNCYSMKGHKTFYFTTKREAGNFFFGATTADWDYVVLEFLNETRGVWEIMQEDGDKYFYKNEESN